MVKCYRCYDEGLTREHVPPRCFFAKPYPSGLMTVPSCSAHNNDNSKDVEYVRNIIAVTDGVNDVGFAMYPTIERSLDRRPAFAQRIINATRSVIWQGQEVGVITTEIGRFNSVMQAIAYAVYYKDFGSTYQHQWVIYHATMRKHTEVLGKHDSLTEELQAMLRNADVVTKDTAHPEVFKYACYPADAPDEHRLIYKFQFYEVIVVYALGLTLDELRAAETVNA